MMFQMGKHNIAEKETLTYGIVDGHIIDSTSISQTTVARLPQLIPRHSLHVPCFYFSLLDSFKDISYTPLPWGQWSKDT
jgi:hypothetical protein